MASWDSGRAGGAITSQPLINAFIVVMDASTTQDFVGASLLAMDVNDDEGCLNERGDLSFIASELAPTGTVNGL
ncbi:hypothetical protein DBR45_51375 [Pseudomonas sp. HMWF031]|nr:hypothetical protein DBR45_51375 [Pseudomonas sp. HMWF031]